MGGEVTNLIKCIHCGCEEEDKLYTADLKEFECIDCLYERDDEDD